MTMHYLKNGFHFPYSEYHEVTRRSSSLFAPTSVAFVLIWISAARSMMGRPCYPPFKQTYCTVFHGKNICNFFRSVVVLHGVDASRVAGQGRGWGRPRPVTLSLAISLPSATSRKWRPWTLWDRQLCRIITWTAETFRKLSIALLSLWLSERDSRGRRRVPASFDSTRFGHQCESGTEFSALPRWQNYCEKKSWRFLWRSDRSEWGVSCKVFFSQEPGVRWQTGVATECWWG